MIKNYLKTAIRNLRRNKLFSMINVLGLSVGISASLVIYLIVQYDFSFDKFQKNGDRIYRIVTEMKFSGSTFPNSGVPQPLSDAVRSNVSGIEESAAFMHSLSPHVNIPATGNAKPGVFRYQTAIIVTDEHYFKLFPDYQWLAGSPETTLQMPFRTVLTESRAQTYFPGLSPSQVIGRQVIYNDSIPCTVEGIVKDLAKNTDFTFKEFISTATMKRAMKDQLNTEWGSVNSNYQFLVRLMPGTSPRRIEQQIAAVRAKLSNDRKDTSNVTRHQLQPLADIHFNAVYDNFDQRMAHKPTLYGLLLVALFLLALGCINFINLTTAQAGQRAKEIGIRKTMGSSRRQLIFQFLSEAFLLTLTGALLSVLLTPWLLRVFSDFIPSGLHLDILHNPQLILFLLGLIIVVSTLSGFYPALVLSRFNPVLVLKNQAYTGTATTRRALLRKTLTVSQFVIAQIFIMATLIVGRQIRYSLDKDLGYKKDAIVYFRTPYKTVNLKARRAQMLDRLRAIPGIAMVSEGSEPPASGGTMSMSMTYKDGQKSFDTDVQIKSGDSNYMKLYGIQILAGRDLLHSDSAKEIVINNTYAHILGFTDPKKALGKTIGDDHLIIVGVIADFHQASLHKQIKPLAFTTSNQRYSLFHIALQQPSAAAGTAGSSHSEVWKSTISQIEKTYKEIYPDESFKISFFDESIAKFYTAEQNISRLLRWATGLTIFISCLGLLGLVVYSTRLRTKEIGVRKVLGASVPQLVSILSKDFIRLVCIAFVIAVPIGWWATHQWLQSFAYRTPVSWWLFAISGLVMLAIALLTLSVQTIRAANANPVDSLRSE